jgi:hypothetical protein
MDDYEQLEDFIFELRDENLEFQVGLPNFVETDLVEGFKPLANAAFLDLQRQYRIPELQGLRHYWEAEFPKKIHAIRSMVGDDEVVTSNCLIYAILCVVIGPLLARIKISWHDVQFNRELYNYAEGWILLPPSKDSDFESVNRYNKTSGVPFVLDPIKFKDLSAVRKQSDMEVDLPSKFRSLAQKAAWTNRSWFTWDMHQMALLLGLEVFDFTKSKLFPFLFRWEGGCGGPPPWNNLLTAAGAIFRHRRGRATKGILGIMADANNLHSGNIKPADAFFAKNLSLALSGDSRWADIRSELERQKNETADLGLPFNQRVIESADRTIPSELITKSQIVTPDDALTGVAISFLRDKGYITTELDLVTYVEDRRRLDAIWGIVPMMEIEDQIALRKQEYAEAYLEMLSDLSKTKKLEPRVYGLLGEIEDPMSPWALSIMEQYYTMRVEQTSHFTSFIYNEQVRVFKTSDVEEYFARGLRTIRDGFCESVGSRYRPDFRRSVQLPDDRAMYDDIEHWLESDNLDQLLKNQIPAGIGPDDARITRDALSAAGNDRGAGATGLLYLIISSDKRMVHAVQQLVQHENPSMNVRVLGMSVIEFIAYCSEPKGRFRPNRDPDWLRNLRIYNPYSKTDELIAGSLLEALRKESRFMYLNRIVSARVFYDYPNINRSLKRFTLEPGGFVQEWSGGFLTKARAEADKSLARRELGRIRTIVDFKYMYKRAIAPHFKGAARLFSAKQGRDLQGSWRKDR